MGDLDFVDSHPLGNDIPPLKLAAARAILSDKDPEVLRTLAGNRDEVMVIAQNLLVSAGVKAAISRLEEDDENRRILDPELAEHTLQTLKDRFESQMSLHEGCEWANVRTALENNPEALWSIAELEKNGHEPDIYNFDSKGFDIGTCSKETPYHTRNCIYDDKAAEHITDPKENFSGSAVGLANEMGANIMTLDQYLKLRGNKEVEGQFKRLWLFTDYEIRELDAAIEAYAIDGERVRVREIHAADHYYDQGWRATLRVEW